MLVFAFSEQNVSNILEKSALTVAVRDQNLQRSLSDFPYNVWKVHRVHSQLTGKKKKEKEKKNKERKNNNNTYARAMYQFLEANDAAASKRARPTKVMVGAIANGPIYRSNRPINPLTPRTISNNDATIIAPCIWHQHKISAKVIMRPSPTCMRLNSFLMTPIYKLVYRNGTSLESTTKTAEFQVGSLIGWSVKVLSQPLTACNRWIQTRISWY